MSLMVPFLVMSVPANAEVTEDDLHIAARALSFMESPFTGETRVGIVYDPDNARSARQAETVRSILADGLEAGELILTPVMVPIGKGASADVDLLFLTEYLGDRSATISELVSSKGIPCVTTDIAQVRSGACVMAVRSAPRVEILVNRQAADLTGTSFTAVFRMMITEL